MSPSESLTPAERAALDKTLLDALSPLATALRSRATGLPEQDLWKADPVDVALSVLGAWKVLDTEVKRLTAIAAGTAGSYGATYEQIGATWGITRQGARKKWPDAVRRTDSGTATIELFGGTAELTRDAGSGRWRWSARGADGATGPADGPEHPDSPAVPADWATKEEAAAHAGVFLKEHALAR
ncbi:hypothetical protein ACFVQ4_34580 [Streptomyces laurentii]|uniref:hypothetical protein n=1 Tax=Streptomyces laurentii TaxID=39478 RepID=UPI003693D279